MHQASLIVCLAIFGMTTIPTQSAYAQQPTSPGLADEKAAADAGINDKKGTTSEKADQSREQKLAEYLSGAIFAGKFTIDGREEGSPKTEEYTISKCEKLDAPDMYRMTARIKYGETDSEVPLDIKILWSGNTPVITLDSLWIPGMGTFGARVLIHSGRYAGTWQHDAVGGHMFGKIKK
jgi:hypothetical protein